MWSLEGGGSSIWCYLSHWRGEAEAGKTSSEEGGHFNYLKPCFSPPETHEKPSQLTSSSHAEDTPQGENLRDGQQPSRGTLVDSGDVELEWLENPVATVTEVSHPFQEREYSGESSGTLSTSPRTADLPCQSEVSQVSDEPRREPCHAARPRREWREPVWLRNYVRTVLFTQPGPWTL